MRPIPPLGDHLAVDVVADRGATGERQPGDDREDRRKGDGGNEAEQNRPADRVRKMDRRHVRAANQIGDLVELPRRIDVEIARVGHQDRHGAESQVWE